MELESTSTEWSIIATWIAREELSLSRLLLYRILLTLKTKEQDDPLNLKLMLRALTYGRMSQGLVYERLTMITDNFVVKSEEIDAIIVESMAIFHQCITEFIRVVDKHARSNMSNTVNTDSQKSHKRLMLTELLGATWELLESYDTRRFRLASLSLLPETAQQIESEQQEWLESLLNVANLCNQVLLKNAASSMEAFSYIDKIKGFVQRVGLKPRQNQVQSQAKSQAKSETVAAPLPEKSFGGKRRKMDNTRTKPSIFIK